MMTEIFAASNFDAIANKTINSHKKTATRKIQLLYIYVT